MFPELNIFKTENFRLLSGKILKDAQVSYHTWGILSDAKDNAVLVCHFFSGSRHAAGRYSETGTTGWWDSLIGPGKPIDTDRFFVICSDTLCCLDNSEHMQSTGPRSINPATGKPYNRDFPVITIQDMVIMQHLLIQSLQIKCLYAVAGPSMGALQSMTWSMLYPNMVQRVAAITASPSLDAFARIYPLRIAMNSIENDSEYKNGNYLQENTYPAKGMKNALIGLTLIGRPRRWADSLNNPFGSLGSPYSLEGNYNYEREIAEIAEIRAKAYDPNSFLFIAQANILFRLFQHEHELKTITARYFLAADTDDLFFPLHSVREFYDALKRNNVKADLFEYTSNDGHLGGVTGGEFFSDAFSRFLLT